MLIRDILSDKGSLIYSVAPDTPVREAVALMIQRDISSVLVLDGDKMAGLITLREILRALHKLGGGVLDLPASQVMSASPVTCGPDDSVEQLLTAMTEHHVTHLPVFEEGALAGILSFQDVARSALKDATFENSLLKTYIRHWPETA